MPPLDPEPDVCIAGNHLDYSCGCRYPTTEPQSQHYDHMCAACYKAAAKGKRW